MHAQSDSASQKRERFVQAALAYKGTPYVYGGLSRSGIDCSGLVYAAARDSGTASLPRTASTIYSKSTIINASQRQRGDLVFFKTTGNSVSHVGIYLGNNQFVHSASDGPKTGVIISTLSESYWARTYFASGSIFGGSGYVASADNSKDNSNSSNSYNNSSSSYNSNSPFDLSVSSVKNRVKSTLSSRIRSYFDIDFTAFIDWSFFTEEDMHFYIKNISVQADWIFDYWNIKPGLMARVTYDFVNLDSFRVPVCFSLSYKDNLTFYSGVVFEYGNYKMEDSEKILQAPFYPGIFGISLKTPKINFMDLKFALVQDISFTCFDSIDGTPLTFMESLVSGLSFSTGISVTLP